MWRIVLVNASTSEALTTLMVEIAREFAPACFRIDGRTAHGAEAIVIGGGPLGRVAKALSGKVGVPVIEAIPEAVRNLATALGAKLLVEALARIGVRRHPMPSNI